MWTFHEFPVILVFCICKILAKNQDSEFGCDAQDKRGVLWKSESEGLAWHSCDEIDYGNHDLGKYKLHCRFLNLPVWANFYGLTDLSTSESDNRDLD